MDTDSTSQAKTTDASGRPLGAVQRDGRRPPPADVSFALEGRSLTGASHSRGWAHVTGWAALRQITAWLAGLLGIRRTTSMAMRGETIVVHEQLSVFGSVVHEEEQDVPANRVASVSTVRALPSLPLVAGAAILVGTLIWGALHVVEGVVGSSAKMVLLGLSVVAIGAVADILLFLVTRNLFHPGTFGVSIHLVDGRSKGVWGVPEETANRARKVFGGRRG